MKIHIKRKGWFRTKLVGVSSILILPVQFHPRLTWTGLADLTGEWESVAYVPAPTTRQDRIAL